MEHCEAQAKSEELSTLFGSSSEDEGSPFVQKKELSTACDSSSQDEGEVTVQKQVVEKFYHRRPPPPLPCDLDTKAWRTRTAVKMFQGPSTKEYVAGELAAGEEVELFWSGTYYSDDGLAFVPVQRSPSFGWATLEARPEERYGAKHVFMSLLDTGVCPFSGVGDGRGHIGAEWKVLTSSCIQASIEIYSGVLYRLPPGSVVVQTGPAFTLDGLTRVPIAPKDVDLPIVNGWVPTSTLAYGCFEQLAAEWPQMPDEICKEAGPPAHVKPAGRGLAPIIPQAYTAYETYPAFYSDPFFEEVVDDEDPFWVVSAPERHPLFEALSDR